MESNLAGPGAFPDIGEAPTPLLQGATEYEYVEIVNPLSVDFVGIFGVTKPVRVPFPNEEEIKKVLPFPLKNPAHTGRANITNKTVIKAGQTLRLLGNEAQVIVNQLVTEIMMREDNRLLLADPFARRQVEQRVVLRRGSVDEYLGHRPVSIQEQLQGAMKDAEAEFPTITNPGTAEGSQPNGDAPDTREKRTPGRPKKTV